MDKLKYKNWYINITTHYEGIIRCVIKNAEMQKAFAFVRKCPTNIYHIVEVDYRIFGKEKEEKKTYHYETDETISDTIEEAKGIIDMFEEIKNYYLFRNIKIKELKEIENDENNNIK